MGDILILQETICLGQGETAETCSCDIRHLAQRFHIFLANHTLFELDVPFVYSTTTLNTTTLTNQNLCSRR